MKAEGIFEVDLQPLDSYTTGREGIRLSRLSINKIFHGDLEAKSQGEMLSAMTATTGSAGYVAIEQVNGLLHGRPGTFVLQHFGMMSNGENHLILEVVPHSGTNQLTTLSGKMIIHIEDAQHFYTFEYSLA